VNVSKLSFSIVDALHERGHTDDQIANMSPEMAFIEYCNWNGLLGWGIELIDVIDSLRASE
jgi:hypothetical protein